MLLALPYGNKNVVCCKLIGKVNPCLKDCKINFAVLAGLSFICVSWSINHIKQYCAYPEYFILREVTDRRIFFIFVKSLGENLLPCAGVGLAKCQHQCAVYCFLFLYLVETDKTSSSF